MGFDLKYPWTRCSGAKDLFHREINSDNLFALKNLENQKHQPINLYPCTFAFESDWLEDKSILVYL